jgi:hypothetical protein
MAQGLSLKGSLDDSPVSDGPVHRRSEEVHGIRQRALMPSYT